MADEKLDTEEIIEEKKGKPKKSRPRSYKCKCCGARVEASIALKDDKLKNTYYCSQECKDKGLQGVDSIVDFMYQKYGVRNTGIIIIKKQYDNYLKAGYKHNGILLTLHYVCDILEEEVDPSFGIVFVPYYYQEAKTHYERIKRNKELAKDFKDNEVRYIKPNNEVPLSLLQYRFQMKGRSKN